MANENLIVNSKTDILEFKRKYNLLVGNSSVKINTTNITTLTDTELSNLRCGDMVRKKTGNQFHNYIVSYKEENKGICLSYYDCGYTETVSYDYTDGHWVYNSTDISLCNSLEEITDSQGNKRFQDFAITPKVISGVNFTYSKASLSGTHLLIVFAGNIEENSSVLAGEKFAEIANFPTWLMNKIVPTYSAFVGAFNGQLIRSDDYNLETISLNMDKDSSKITLALANNISSDAATRYFRIALDLLIDNE